MLINYKTKVRAIALPHIFVYLHNLITMKQMIKERLFKKALLVVLLCAIGTGAWASTTDYSSQMSNAQGDWTGAGGTYGDGVERYNGNDNAFAVGNVLAQTINNLPNGYFEVEFYAWENFANWNNNANIGYGNGKAQVFANVSVEDIHVIKNTGGRAFDDANTYKLLALVTDGTLTYGIKNIAAGGNWAVCKPKSLTFLGEKVDDNTDLTSAINNYHFVNCENNAFPGWTISAPNGGNVWKNGDTRVEYWISSAANGSFDYYQTLSNLPGGKYSLSASMWNSTDNEAGANFDGGGKCGVYGASSNGTAFEGVTTDSRNDALSTYTTDGVVVTDGTLRIGVKNNGTMTARWFGVDWITLKYLGSCLMNEADALPSTAVTVDKWYAFAIPSDGSYTLRSSAAAAITYTQDGTQLASHVTSTSTQSMDANGSMSLSLNAGALYVKANTETMIAIEIDSYEFTPGQDITSVITNPGFEADGTVVNLSESNLTGVTGWTLLTAQSTNDVGTRAYSNATYASLNGVGDYCFNCYWEGKPLTQTLSHLPAGTYELSALVTTGNATALGTVYLNAGDVHSTGYARKSANANYYHREKLVFTLTSAQDVTIGIRGGSDPAEGATKGAWNEDGYWWYKCDDFQLKYLGEATQEALYSQLQTLLPTCVPWTSGDEYAINYSAYQSYTPSNSVAELTAAISYLTNEYEQYVWEYATTSHPYDLGLIKNADYANGDTDWKTALNKTGSGDYSVTSDETQTNFFQSSYNTWMRHSSIYQEGIILDEGIYRLSAKMKGSPKDDESTYLYATTGGVDHWGSTLFAGDTYYGYLTTDVASSWSTVNAHITLDAPATVRVGVLSWGNNRSGGNGGAFAVDDWKLEKISYAVVPEKGVVSAYGPAPVSEINAALTSAIGAVDLRKATGLSAATISTTNNENLLVFANSGQVDNSNNVVVDGQCSSLVLTDGHPFLNPTQFTATSASYTLSAVASGKDVNDEDVSFGTLMIPFEATSLPDGGKAYTLDQGVDLLGGTLKGTEASTIAANSPVLVTAIGSYTGSNVTVPAVASGATRANGELVGTYTAMTAVEGSYVLQNHTGGEGVAFYLVGSTKPTVNPFRAYIKAQGSNARALRVVLGETSGISQTANDLDGKEQYFNLQGRRTEGPTKGLNVVRTADGSVRKQIVK